MLEIYKLEKKYGKNKVVDDVNFIVPTGKAGILLGPNGAGKSTTIKCIAGLLRYKGNILVQGKPAKSMEAKKIFAYVPEMPYMYDALTVKEHLDFIERGYGIGHDEKKQEELLKRFELWDKQEKLGNELSKGMMQKVSICCALILNPEVIMLDEPMVGLDPKAIKELKSVILELREKGTTILISTHMLEMVKDLWDVMFVMNQGKIIGEYQKDESLHKDIEDLFFEITGGGEA